ncbi:MAG: hypothetical protein WD069_15080 [Planctomycetales bacterium]
MKSILSAAMFIAIVTAFAAETSLFAANESQRAEPASAQTAPAAADSVPAGFRKVSSSQLGVAVLCPVDWVEIAAPGAAHAFVLRLPADDPETPPAIALCEIGHAPADLEEYRKRIEKQGQQPQRGRRLAANEMLEPAEGGPRFRILEVDWEYAVPGGGGTLHQFRRFAIHGAYLYTFTLNADPAALALHREPFRRMVESAAFSDVETGLERRADGHWVQRERGFGMQLPAGWRPSYLPNDEVVYSAVGTTEKVFSDSLLVTTTPARPIRFEQLKRTLPAQIESSRENTKVVRCEIVEAGGLQALETVIETQQGPFEFTIVERRIEGKHANYEARFTILRSHYEKRAAEFSKTLDSFREFDEPKAERRL